MITIFLISCEEEERLPLTLDEGQITADVHKNNKGKIAFMNEWIALDDFSQMDFVDQLTLTNESDFAFRMFLDKTLTFYLNQLEPNLPVRELCDKGNFQITFFVDDKKLYTNNLQPGAGSCEYKNSATAYGIPLINKKNIDHWGRFLWAKFMGKGGGQDALSGNKHKLNIIVRPYIENDELKVGKIIAQGEVILNKVEQAVDESQIAIQSIQSTDKWNISNEKYDKSSIRNLNKKIAQNYFKDITSIVVIKDGKLLIEEYFNDANRNTLHDTRSVGKTLASTIMGIAIGDGHLKNVQQTLNEFYTLNEFQNYSAEKDNVTLKSLLTMSSGIDGSDMYSDSPGHEENMYPTSDWVKFALDLPMDKNKTIGKNWDYFTAGVVILGDILNKSLPDGLQKYADEKLFKPLGITNYQWQYTPTNVPNTAGGFQMSALDNARWGQLYIDNGAYENKQIIPEVWVKSSLKKYLPLPELTDEFYGYLLFNKTFKINDTEIEAFNASGNGGNKIMILKDINVVIVITARAYNQAYGHYQANEIIERYLLPSIINQPK